MKTTSLNFSKLLNGKHARITIEIICGMVALLFIYTATSKLLDMDHFEKEIIRQPYPDELTPYIKWTIPFLELAICVGLYIDAIRYQSLWASTVLMLFFTIYTSIVLIGVFDRHPCSCGGVISSLTWPQHFAFNLFFTIVSLWGVAIERVRRQFQPTLKMNDAVGSVT